MQVCEERNAVLEAELTSLKEEIKEILSASKESHSAVAIVKKKKEEDESSMINLCNQIKDEKEK